MRLMSSKLYPFRSASAITLLLGLTVVLSACAEGQAHFTIQRNGMADLSMTMALSDRALGVAGQPDLMSNLAEQLRKTGMEAESFDKDGKAGISATRQFDLKELDRIPLKLPAGIEVERSAEPRFFYTKQRVAVTVDLPKLVAGEEGAWAGKLEELPAFTKKLIQSQADFDFLLTAPLKLGGNGADEIRDGGRTQVWHLKLFEPNRFETSINVPNMKRIGYTAGLALLVVLVCAAFGIRAFAKRKSRRGAD